MARGINSVGGKKFGRHPTQKPVYLIERILLASTKENDVILDPFCGSSTTGVACKRLKRNYIGIDNNLEYIKLSAERLEDICKKEYSQIGLGLLENL